MAEYNIKKGPFRFWCQKILPLVYDDSLSYYELLCRVVDYLNKEMEDISTVTTDMQELKEYVDNYFVNLDVQEEINNKLDVMAEDGTLTAIISQIVKPFLDDYAEDLNALKVTKVIFMPGQYYDGAGAAGDCTVYKSKNDKVMMFDAGATRSYTLIKAELEKFDITHINYFELTHYHPDHYGNIENLITDGYIDNETICYLPRSATVPVSNWGDEEHVRELLQNNEVITPTNDTVIDFDDIHVTFFNCSDADMAYHNTKESPDCNDYSICNYVSINETLFLMTGDIQPRAEQYVHDMGYIRQCDILKIPHHSYDNAAASDFYLTVSPTYSVAMANAHTEQTDVTGNNSRRSAYLASLGSKIYNTGNGAVYVGVSDELYTLYPNTSNPLKYKFRNQTATIYVDSTYSGELSTGSSKYPFKTLNDAIYLASAMAIKAVNISFLSDYNDTRQVGVSNALPYITVNGSGHNVTIGDLRVYKCTCRFNDLTIESSSTITVDIENSGMVILSNVVMTTDKRNATTITNGRAINANMDGKCYLSGCTISNARCALCANANGEIHAYELLGVNNEYLIHATHGDNITVLNSNIAFEHFITSSALLKSAVYNGVYGYSQYGNHLLYANDGKGTETTYAIDLSDNALYSRRMILFTDASGTVKIINRWGGSIAIHDVFTPESPTATLTKDGFIITVVTDSAFSFILLS